MNLGVVLLCVLAFCFGFYVRGRIADEHYLVMQERLHYEQLRSCSGDTGGRAMTLDTALRDWYEAQQPYREGSSASPTPEAALAQGIAEERRRDAADDALYEVLKSEAER